MMHRPAPRAAALALLLAHGVASAAGASHGPADALQHEGEAALQRGEARLALDSFERAASLRHSAVIEIGIVRAWMQMGEYRRALAFAGHTAFAHPESNDGAALYALLLRAGGQAAVASRLIDAALQRAPDDVALQRARAVLSAALDDARVQALAAVLSSGAAVPAQAEVIGNATLLPDGRHALVPQVPLPAGAALWLRNGLGRTVRAEILRRDAEQGLVLLALAEPLPAPASGTQRPFPGSPAFVVAFQRTPTWPHLHSGFLGAAMANAQGQWLGVEAGAHGSGAPVFDGAGRLVGMAMSAAGDARLRFVSLVAAASLLPVAQTDGAAASRPLGIDDLYERGLRAALQLIAVR